MRQACRRETCRASRLIRQLLDRNVHSSRVQPAHLPERRHPRAAATSRRHVGQHLAVLHRELELDAYPPLLDRDVEPAPRAPDARSVDGLRRSRDEVREHAGRHGDRALLARDHVPVAHRETAASSVSAR